MINNKKALLIMGIMSFLLFSCSAKVSSLKEDKDLQLEAEEGYLLIAVDTNYELERILVSGEKWISLTNEDLQKGSNYIFLNLPAGEYELTEIKVSSFSRFKLDDPMWSFQVKPGVVTYVGHLDFKRLNYGYSAYIQLLNKASQALEYMEEKFPVVLKSRKMEYGGLIEDRFFQEIYKNKGI